ncbi:GNAT family N-acetyltransferase [Acidilutibacter cellobiosedens]|jgi:GNAT superfamily N-acetyltransferase|uniref:GNAT family N-acetyltransferase n=1 Tax=Acidilutibacter cellobiosedens TaxID=2507161 RepID=A0A410QD14_9FIRM|nr:GNAT family N-acetyltransferase [Acidilutibacter cellobiosedens]QAT61819.1 GNAT family N-acetyltransferase [Acidilutibacter cellobiosedens]
MYTIIPICDELRKDVVDFISDNWGSPIIVSKGKVHFADILEGYVAVENGEIDGVITYSIENGECEIVSLDSLVENQGIGSNLINKVIEKAKENKCRRVWLITTNDNTKAIRYYQKRGFYMKEIHINAIQRSRKLKPQIPLYGFDNIPILHEIEFEKII